MTEGRSLPGEPSRIWAAGEYTLLADSHTTAEGITYSKGATLKGSHHHLGRAAGHATRQRWDHRLAWRHAGRQSQGRERTRLEARRVPLPDVGACRGVGRLSRV
jgi:hypothetical protein